MTERLTVFGFGSFFRGERQASDIDLLLLHRSADAASCRFAIDCKTKIRTAVPNADVVMLSRAEADDLQFLTRAQAVTLGELSDGDTDTQVRAIVCVLGELRSAQHKLLSQTPPPIR